MKKLFLIALVLFIFSFAACKKAEETPAQGKQAAENKQAPNQKKPKRAKGPHGLQIYQEDKLIVAIPREEYLKIMTTSIKIDGKDQVAISLSDLLKSKNVMGKNVVLRGPNRAASLTWEEATKNPIYIYPFKNRLQVFRDPKTLPDSKIPVTLTRIELVENPVASNEKPTKKPGK